MVPDVGSYAFSDDNSQLSGPMRRQIIPALAKDQRCRGLGGRAVALRSRYMLGYLGR